jgi:predicted MPP superfamily phosphohydrolase
MLKNTLLIVLGFLAISTFAKDFVHDVKTEKKPWNHVRFQNQNKEFSFVILPDRAGGERKKGIWASAVQKANMFHPDFIITVGDMIEGINSPKILNKKTLENQYNELIEITKNSAAPIFYLVGNHDISRTRPGFPRVNEISAEVWTEKFGATYYSFIYKDVLFLCLNQQEGRDSRKVQCGLTPQQTKWALDTIKKNANVKWTLIFVHSPWTWAEAPFKQIEKAMGKRNYTVFSGDFHFYNKFIRNNRNYYLLATAGGTSKLRGVKD